MKCAQLHSVQEESADSEAVRLQAWKDELNRQL